MKKRKVPKGNQNVWLIGGLLLIGGGSLAYYLWQRKQRQSSSAEGSLATTAASSAATTLPTVLPITTAPSGTALWRTGFATQLTADQVRALQSALTRLGLNVGTAGIDGAMGQNTWNAIEAYRRARIRPTGVPLTELEYRSILADAIASGIGRITTNRIAV